MPSTIDHPSKISALDLQQDEANHVTARMGFVEHSPDLEEAKFAFACRYAVEEGERQTNYKTGFCPVQISNLRGQEHLANIDTCGFAVHQLRTEHRYGRFERKEDEDLYVLHLREQIKQDFGAKHVDVERCRVRRRDPTFPKSSGRPFEHHQPSNAAHIDLNVGSAHATAEKHQIDQLRTGGRFLILNIWKPLRGPLQDWPLAVCDARTVDREFDIKEAVIVHQIVENHDHKMIENHNCQIHFNEEQKWYYLRDQEPEELLIFRQYDSQLRGNNGVPHTSFADPTTPPGALLRESVEVMAVLYFD